ncbi:hypothetical protein BKH24_08480 [Actinomyces oris]|uniref:variant leucine-rich repeat-containing protein n=1 Tax=Actinomyces oris TaxID=544580 RepID=UPI00094DA243|nr:hypothetical protein [Actinomyces oris]OLO59382.1 hypothetical protein BKH24_08480 [Actinomyces oris]
MDPVQLMMAAHQANAAVAAQTPDQALQAAIAQSRPDLWAPLSTNPAAYPDLLGWLASTGNVEVLANLRARGYLTDDAAANAAGGVGDAGAVAAPDSAAGEPTVDPALAQEDQAESAEPVESAEAADDGVAPVDEDESADESGPVDGDEAEDVQATESADETVTEPDTEDSAEEATDADDSGEAGDEQEAEESTEDAEGDEVESQASQDQSAEDVASEAVGSDADSGEAGDEQEAEESTEAADEAEGEEAAESAAEAAVEPDAETATREAQESGTDEPDDEAEDDVEDAAADVDSGEDDASEEQAAEETAVDESADEHVEDAAGDELAEDAQAAESAAETATEPDAEPEAAADAADGEDQEPRPDDLGNEAEDGAEDAAEAATDAAADSDNNDTTVLAPASQRHEVDSADTTDFTASAQSVAVVSGWTADSAAPAAGSAESAALPVPPPPSAEDIAAWAETPSGAPSGFSAGQPAVELDMFGPQMMAQMPPPQRNQPSTSSTGRLIAIIVALLLVIVGGGGLWAGNYFANKGKDGDSSDTSQDKADSNGDKDGKQNGHADAAATSTASALPSGAVKACSSMPTFTITSVEDGQGELKVQGTMVTSCAEGDFLAGSSNQVLVYSSTSPTGGADVDHLVASGTFDLSSDPLIIPNGGRTVTLRFGEEHYFRTAKDLDLKGLSVRPSFDRGTSTSVTAKSSTNSPMTLASSASANANQEAQDEQAAGDAIQWQIKHDYPIVMNSMRGKWTPQLSSKKVGLVAEGQTWNNRSILAEFLKTRQSNPKAVIIETSQWPVYDVSGWWVTLSGELYDDADQANAWCDAQGYDSDHCLAKRIESNGSSQGTTKTR